MVPVAPTGSTLDRPSGTPMTERSRDATSRRGPDRSRHPAVRRLYGAELLSGAGDGIFWVALIATLAGERRFDMLLVCAIVARLGPRALLSVPAGRLVDRSDLVRLIVRTDLVRAALMAGLAATVGLGGGPVLMLVIVLASYVVAVPTRPAMSALLPHLSDETHLASANAMLSTIRQVMTFVGPMFGVGVVAWSTTAAFAANALSFLASALLVQTIPAGLAARSRRRARTGPGVERAPRAAVATGTVVRSVPGLDILIALIGAMYFVRGAEMVLHVLVVRDLLEADPASIGYLGAGVGLGALVAAPVARRSAQMERAARPIGLTLVLTAIPTAALVWVERLATATALLVVVGFAMVVFEVVSVVTIQRTVSRSSLGRVFGAVNMAHEFIYTCYKLARHYPPDRTVLENISLSFYPGRQDRRDRAERLGQVEPAQDHGRPRRRLLRRGPAHPGFTVGLPGPGARARPRQGRARAT
jgi:hypothetical protein